MPHRLGPNSDLLSVDHRLASVAVTAVTLPTTKVSTVRISNVRFTSTPAVRGANNSGVIQFDEEGRVIPTWEDDDDGDAA